MSFEYMPLTKTGPLTRHPLNSRSTAFSTGTHWNSYPITSHHITSHGENGKYWKVLVLELRGPGLPGAHGNSSSAQKKFPEIVQDYRNGKRYVTKSRNLVSSNNYFRWSEHYKSALNHPPAVASPELDAMSSSAVPDTDIPALTSILRPGRTT